MEENPNKQKRKILINKIYSPKREKFLDVPKIRKKLNAFKNKLCISRRPTADAGGGRIKNALQYLKKSFYTSLRSKQAVAKLPRLRLGKLEKLKYCISRRPATDAVKNRERKNFKNTAACVFSICGKRKLVEDLGRSAKFLK